MIYELKQKIRHSKQGEAFANWLKDTPLFPACYRLLTWLGLTEYLSVVNRKQVCRYFADNKDKINKIAENLADKKSKKIFLKAIHRRCEGYCLLKGTPDDQYFPNDIIRLAQEEVLVDCGAFTGDTIAKFRELTKDHYKKIVAFEPDPLCSAKIVEQKIPRCEVLPYGAWNKKATLAFYAIGNGHSCVEEVTQGYERVKKEPGKRVIINSEMIDHLPVCADMTFLKMDIEGAELNALKGAERTIRKQRPKMAICIYHSNQDLLEIPLWIMSLDMGYKLYVRHHGLCELSETVLYAV